MNRLALALALFLSPGAAMACAIALYDEGYVVPPMTVGADCSFTLPGAETMYTDLSGAAPVNIGGGRIGQRVSRGFGCGYDEEVWIVDCNSGEMIGIAGPRSDDMNQSRRAELLYPPHGVLLFSPETTVPDIAAVVEGAGYAHWTDIMGRLRDIYSENRSATADLPGIDPACGCRIFYPDSALATR